MSAQNVAPSDGTYLVLSDDVQRALQANGVSIRDIITQSKLPPAQAQEVSNPAAPEEGAREVVTVILASAAAVAALTPLITRVIGQYLRRPVIVEDAALRSLLHTGHTHPQRFSVAGGPLEVAVMGKG